MMGTAGAKAGVDRVVRGGVAVTIAAFAVGISGCFVDYAPRQTSAASSQSSSPNALATAIAPPLLRSDSAPGTTVSAAASGTLGPKDIDYLHFLEQCIATRQQIDGDIQQQANRDLQAMSNPANGVPSPGAPVTADYPQIALQRYGTLLTQFGQLSPTPLCRAISASYSTYLSALMAETQTLYNAEHRTAQQQAAWAATHQKEVTHPPSADAAASAFNTAMADFLHQHPEAPADIASIRIPDQGVRR